MDYPLHILTIKLWEWESVKEVADFNINKYGPDEHNVDALETAERRIGELKNAIDRLNNIPS